MEKFMQELAEKLYTERRKKPLVKNDYIALLKAIFGKDDIDKSLNDNAEAAKAVTYALSTIDPLYRYCLEEIYLHGIPQEQLAEEFRRNMNMEVFMDRLIEDIYNSVKQNFMQYIDITFLGMEENHFRELDYQDGVHPDGFPKNNTYYEMNSDKSIVNILRDTLDLFDGYDFSRKEVFERYFLRGQTKEALAKWLSEQMENYVHYVCRTAMRIMCLYPRVKHLYKYVGYKSIFKDIRCSENKNGKCLYPLTISLDEEAEACSLCKINEVREWMDKAISELPPKEKQIIKLLYGMENGSEKMTSTDVAVMLRIDTREQVEEIEYTALKKLRKRALREIRTTYKSDRCEA